MSYMKKINFKCWQIDFKVLIFVSTKTKSLNRTRSFGFIVLQRAVGWCETVYRMKGYPLRDVHWNFRSCRIR